MSSLACPRCGTIFQFRAPAPTATPAPPGKKPQKPAASTPAPRQRGTIQAPPVARPVPQAKAPPPVPARPAVPVAKPAVPVAAPVAGGNDNLVFDSSPGLVSAPARLRRNRDDQPQGKKRIALLITYCVVGLVLLGGAVYGVGWHVVPWFRTQLSQHQPEQRQTLEQANYRFSPPYRGWNDTEEDRDLAKQIRGRMIVNYTMVRSDPPNRMAIYWRDFETRLPTKGEMIDICLRKLRGEPPVPDKPEPDAYFRNLEWELHEDAEVQLAKRQAMLLEFQGVDPDNVLCNGECVMLADRGYGYWFFTWGPLDRKEMLQPEWRQLREGFTLGDKREGWQETPADTELVNVPTIPYTLRFKTALWERKLNAATDPRSLLVLHGHDPTKTRHVGRMATLQVLLLDKAEDPAAAKAAARAYLLERERAEYPDTLIETVRVKDKELDYPADIGGVRGQVMKLRVQNTEDGRQRYAVLGVVQAAEGTVVLWFDCDWNRRDYWEYEFLPLMETFRAVRTAG